ncbi:MAG: zinc-dependent alcohol dehydrogenase family protein [Pseudomonadota bacterium]
MEAFVLKRYGESAKFESMSIPEPVAGSGELVIRVAATSVNTVDTMIRSMGTALPFAPEVPAILGMDVAGVVEAVGGNVEGFAVGDEVYGCAGGLADLNGALADLMVADHRLIAHKPRTLSMRESAALPLVGITAHEGLVRAAVVPGEKVLVHGGAGGVGHVAVQLAKHQGADVYATCSQDSQAEAIRGYGATPINYLQDSVADYVSKHTKGAGFPVIYDSVGGPNMANSFAAASLNGRIATTVSLLELDLSEAHFKGLSIHIVFMLIPMLHNQGRSGHGQILKELAEIADQGALKPLLDPGRFFMSDVAAAYDLLISGKAVGKIVIER